MTNSDHGWRMVAGMQIRQAPAESQVRRLLSDAKLPTADITPEKLETFYTCVSGGEIEGIVGLELYDQVGLLRSLLVRERRRARGLGSALVTHAEGVARANGVLALYLLTTTAEHFFRRRGYERVSRESAPADIQRTSEFSETCPASSAVMVKWL